jgi:hypothetical protein
MESIVYILGAGFSAPLGIPTMANFREKALAISAEDNFAYFNEVFEDIRQSSFSDGYFRSEDSLNIEEVLSKLEMKFALSGNKAKLDLYRKFICDVIRRYTPILKDRPRQFNSVNPIRWPDSLFQDKQPEIKQESYGYFVASLLQLQARKSYYQNDWSGKKEWELVFEHDSAKKETCYDIISLNYDTVIEGYCSYINNQQNQSQNIGFLSSDAMRQGQGWPPVLAKLHGSVEDGMIITPSVTKGLYHDRMPDSWSVAFRVLARASEIRILGYSLPDSDSYIKYLLKAAMTESVRLRRIDVICLSLENVEKNRFEAFVGRRFLRFRNINILDYLGEIMNVTRPNAIAEVESLSFRELERVHQLFMSRG